MNSVYTNHNKHNLYKWERPYTCTAYQQMILSWICNYARTHSLHCTKGQFNIVITVQDPVKYYVNHHMIHQQVSTGYTMKVHVYQTVRL